jgi:hypothetical protein
MSLLGACGESESDAPAVMPAGCIASAADREACGTPSDGTELLEVQETWTTEPAPVFDGQPLRDGVYVQTARTLYCADNYDPPPPLGTVATVLEISGCVLRIIAPMFSGVSAVAIVESFEYLGPGKLHAFVECPVQRDIPNGPFAFDGTTLQVPNSSRTEGPNGEPYDCLSVDTWQKR